MDTLSRNKSRSKSDASEQAGDGNPNDTSTLDKEEGNVLMSIIQQCAFLS